MSLMLANARRAQKMRFLYLLFTSRNAVRPFRPDGRMVHGAGIDIARPGAAQIRVIDR